MLGKIKAMPVSVAALIMIGCIFAGVVLGNAQALRGAAQGTAESASLVRQYSNERAVKAGNLLVLAKRLAADDPATALLDQAVAAQKKAESVSEISGANKGLTIAVQAAREALAAHVAGQDQRLLIAAVDDFDSATQLLGRKVKEYNEGVQTVRDMHAALPARPLLGGVIPEVYP